MKRYQITMPIAGAVYGEITASSQEEALDTFEDNWVKALDKEEREDGEDFYEVAELDIHRKMHTGNVVHYTYSDMEIIEVGDEEEDSEDESED